jgi:polyribonucleotide nucleotidyltransferase
MAAALEYGHNAIQPLIDLQEQMAVEIGKPKRDNYPRFAVEENLIAKVGELFTRKIHDALDENNTKISLTNAIRGLQEEAVSLLVVDEENSPASQDVIDAFSKIYKTVVREQILEHGKRPDGRESDQVRDIWCEIDYSPIAHGSGIFTRGETQILTLATLGTPRDAQEMDNLTPTEKKRYIHHYNFPPFSVGETRFLRGASRREIGHGALAERALLPVIPPEKEFPYTLRLVSEALSSNGSTSMGSVCGSTLALMDAGVPIKAPVAGVAMGLVMDGSRYAILTDIQGIEDALGDMDFKVAGTENGVTALQMDIKISGITAELMSKALEQAHHGRAHILGKMLDVIREPRHELKPHAPRISVIKISVDKIGAVIGPGGKIIRGIQDETGAKIDIEEDGSVFIATTDKESERQAREMIEALTEEAEVGRIYTGKVTKVTDFGAFVEILPGQDGLVHISQLDSMRVERVEDVAREGDEITVMVTDIGAEGKIRLSRQAVLEGWTAEEAIQRDRGGGRSRGGNRGGRRGGNRRDGGRRENPRNRNRR